MKQVADEKNKKGVNVLDLGCGKGGDLLKFQKGPVSHVICADIAETSVDQCEQRYKSHRHRFTAEFVTGDCSKVKFFHLLTTTFSFNKLIFSFAG